MKITYNDNGVPYANLANFVAILSEHKSFRDLTITHSEFYNQTLINGKPLTSEAVLDIAQRLNSIYNSHLCITNITDAIEAASYRRKVSEPQDWIRNLSSTNENILDTWLSRAMCCENTDHIRMVSRKWAIQLVARIMNPGCYAASMLIVKGQQGCRKSTFFKSILPDANWTSGEKINLSKTKEMGEILSKGVCIWEDPELTSLKKSSADVLKRILTETKMTFREAYGRGMAKNYEFQFVFCGSTNDPQFLTDLTGNRRFLVVETNQIDIDWVRANRDTFIKNAYDAWIENNDSYHLTDDEAALVSQTNDRYLIQNPWQAFLSEYIDDNNIDRIKSVELNSLLTTYKVGNMDLGGQMQKLGFVYRPSIKFDGGKVTSGWKRK